MSRKEDILIILITINGSDSIRVIIKKYLTSCAARNESAPTDSPVNVSEYSAEAAEHPVR